MTTKFTPDPPGRGAWTVRGGLLPGTPGSASLHGYYRLAVAGEVPVGSLVVSGADTDDAHESVWAGVKALQAQTNLVTGSPITVDGWFGPATDKAVRAAQTKLKIGVDGVVGQQTTRALFTPIVNSLCSAHAIPVDVLGGIAALESSLDPGAVGVNGYDHGLVQINLQAHPEVTWDQAMSPSFAFSFTADEVTSVHAQWVGKTKADPWDIAVAHHNSPLLAEEWAETGVAPVVSGRSIQIADYVRKARSAW